MKGHYLVILFTVSCMAAVNRNDPAFETFMADLIYKFQRLAHHVGREQFAVVVMVSQQEITDWNVTYQPRDNQGNPLINWDQTLSPENVNQYGNFIVAVPTSEAGEHAESQILPHLEQLLQRFRQTHGNQYPAAIILYSRICPCRRCTDDIIQTFHELNLPNNVGRNVIYTTAGHILNVDPDFSWTELTEHLIAFFRFPYMGQCRNNYYKRSLGELQDVSDCRPLQNYLLGRFGDSLECCVSSKPSKWATADLINRLMAECESELVNLDICLGRVAKQNLGDSCSCVTGVSTSAKLSRYVKEAMQSSTSNLDLHFISKPLDPNNPKLTKDPITSPKELAYKKPITYYSCKDSRQEGLMCSFRTRGTDNVTAGNSEARGRIGIIAVCLVVLVVLHWRK